jgi:hypothetical protein
MRLTRTLVLVGAGAALAYFFDPEHGVRRREKLVQMWDQKVGESPLSKGGETTIVTPPAGMRRTAGS